MPILCHHPTRTNARAKPAYLIDSLKTAGPSRAWLLPWSAAIEPAVNLPGGSISFLR